MGNLIASETLQKLFRRYDKKYFFGVLGRSAVPCQVFWNRKLKRSAYGVFCPFFRGNWRPQIEISADLMEYFEVAKMTLLHEMVHFYLMWKLNISKAPKGSSKRVEDIRYSTHGKLFRNEMIRIAKKGAFDRLW